MPSFAIRRCCWLSATILLLVTAMVSAAEPFAPASQPLSPAEALAKFQLAEPELKIELAAAEPEVIDPVAIRFDERGRMWVAEMRDYPLGPPAGEAPLSKIKVLEDTDHDGRFEKATVFAEKLSIVTLAGRIAWMKDTDNDGKCDVDETWYTGFAEQNSQLRANHPRLALDNHVYVANGLRGGVVVNKRLPNEPPINFQGRDFRFDPLTGKAESISGNGQFGMCFDDWGNRFTCTNRNPVIHVVLEDRYLKLALKIPIAAVVQDVAAAAEKSKVYPISRAWTTSNLHAGTFTAACGVHVYRGDTLRNVLGTNSVFTCDPTGNFIHRELMQPDGPSFTSRPAHEGKEFLASTDEWFRPVDIELGPDGCLYIVDMYRCVIEHPDFVPDELKKRPDQRLGDDRGRIWRIAPKNGVPREKLSYLPLQQKSIKDLEAEIGQAGNAWARETLHRLYLELLQSNDGSLSAKLGGFSFDKEGRKVTSRDVTSQAKVHLLWLMHAYNEFDSETLARFLLESDENVLRQVLLIAEERLASKRLEPLVINQMRVPQTQLLLFQKLLLDLTRRENILDEGENQAEEILQVSKFNNRWTGTTLLLRQQSTLLRLFTEIDAQEPPPGGLLLDITRLIGHQGTDIEALRVLKAILLDPRDDRLPAEQVVLLDALSRGLNARGVTLDKLQGELHRHVRYNSTNIARSAYICLNSDFVPPDVRIAAARLLGNFPNTTSELGKRLYVEPIPEIQATIIASIAQRNEESKLVWQKLLEDYNAQPLPVKRALIESSFRRGDGPKLLLGQVTAGNIQAAEIDPLRRKTLLESKDKGIKTQAEVLFAELNPANRQQALEEYQPVLKLTADAKRGAAVFEKNCSTCHRVGEIGVNVAPDISDSRTKTAAQLLADIIQPNRAIDSNFLGYQLLLKDGTAVSGLLSAETSTSLTLKQPGGKVLTVGRDEVEQLKATGVSLMPDGLEKNIPPESMADLLAYLKNWRYLDGKTPLSP
jgi:putative membrane-bound dehydrogenase-like protein